MQDSVHQFVAEPSLDILMPIIWRWRHDKHSIPEFKALVILGQFQPIAIGERLREERPGEFLVVFISVQASEADQLRALRAGALDFLPKPLSFRVLLAKVAAWRDRGRAT